MVFKVVVSSNEKSYQLEFEDTNKDLIGLTIGENFDGDILGLDGYELKITGGSDKNGFTMRKDVSGSRRIRSLLNNGIGYKPKANGIKRRKTVRGNTISEDIVQINTIVVSAGKKEIADILNTEDKEDE